MFPRLGRRIKKDKYQAHSRNKKQKSCSFTKQNVQIYLYTSRKSFSILTATGYPEFYYTPTATIPTLCLQVLSVSGSRDQLWYLITHSSTPSVQLTVLVDTDNGHYLLPIPSSGECNVVTCASHTGRHLNRSHRYLVVDLTQVYITHIIITWDIASIGQDSPVKLPDFLLVIPSYLNSSYLNDAQYPNHHSASQQTISGAINATSVYVRFMVF